MLHTSDQPLIIGLGGTLRSPSTSLYALETALQAAEVKGARTILIDLAKLDLPFYMPGKALHQYSPDVQDFVKTVSQADGMIWSTASYHGTLPGVMKNALDFLEFLAKEATPYLDGKAIGLIATAGGTMAAVNTLNTLGYVAQALRATVVPMQVAIHQARQAIHPLEGTIQSDVAAKLDKLGALTVDLSTALKRKDELQIAYLAAPLGATIT